MIRTTFFIVLLSLVGCSEYCEDRLSSLVILAQHAEASKSEKYMGALRRTLYVCPIPKTGVKQPLGGSIHAAQVYFILGDTEAAAEALESGAYTMSGEQEFYLMSHAVVHENSDYFRVVLDAGLNPNASLSGTGVTVFMNAAHAGSNSDTRMQQLIDHGANPFTISDDGFSALDSAVFAESDMAVEFMLRLIEQSYPARMELVDNAIDIADRVDESRAVSLRDWRDSYANTPVPQ